MTTTHPSRIFNNGTANTLFVTIPADIVSDSQFPFEPDDSVIVSIENGQLIVSIDPGAATA